MELDENIITELVDAGNLSGLRFRLDFEGMSFALDDVRITRAGPDAGGFRMRARVADRRIVGLASRAMLGPSAEFADIRVSVRGPVGGSESEVCLHTNLVSSMEGSSFVELSLAIVGTDALGRA